MAAAPEPRLDLDTAGARKRWGAALRQAWDGAENAPLEDETRRLMLHLSHEDEPMAAATSSPKTGTAPRRRSLLNRLLGRTTPHRRG